VCERVRRHWAQRGRGEHLLFSFHGLPQRYADAGDPYPQQCERGAREIAARLGLDGDDWTLSYQSRVGREPWLQPYTDHTLAALAKRGVRRLDVICPGFSVDCLETLEEIAMQGEETFTEHGGESLNYIACLNDGQDHIDALAGLIRRNAPDWLPPA